MMRFDFLSLSPSIFIKNGKKGKNKLGGFFSIIFFLIMLAISIYYFYRYFFGLDYTVQFYKDNLMAMVTSEEEYEAIKAPKTILLNVDNPNKADLDIYLSSNNTLIKVSDKCNDYFELDPNGNFFCFNLSFYHMDKDKINIVYFYCNENCNDPLGRPALLYIQFYARNLIIDHTEKNPLLSKYAFGDAFHVAINNNLFENALFVFTPIFYISSEIFSTKTNTYIKTYLSQVSTREIFQSSKFFFAMNLGMVSDCDVYKREYKSFLNTLSTIGGLFSTLKLIFGILVAYYSNFENNAEITKSVFLKKDIYEFKIKNNIPLEKKLDIELHNEKKTSTKENNFDIEIPDEVKIKRKKFKINKKEQYFFSFLNCCKKRRTMKILNLCNDFVQNYLSAENIIFNMILFENYYKDNPIKIKKNSYLSEIEKEIEPDDFNEDLTLLNDFHEK